MKNLFLVNSSINLLSTFVLVNSKFKNDENYLALVHPHGYSEWSKDEIISFMASEQAGFKKVFQLTNKSFYKNLNFIRKDMSFLKFNSVFVGNDCGVQNQLLLSALKINQFYRIDDGIGSYYNESAKRTYLKSKFHKLQINILRILMGISLELPVNTIAMGESKAALGDYLLMPEMLRRVSPNVYEITEEMIKKGIDALLEQSFFRQKLFKYEYILYLGETVTEIPKYKFTFDDEIEFIKGKIASLKENQKIIYKPHPNDKKYKIEYIKKNFKDVIITENKVPVEIILCKEPQIKEIISFHCTTLVFAKKFVNRNIKRISLIRENHNPVDSVYVDMLKKSGVEFYYSKDKVK